MVVSDDPFEFVGDGSDGFHRGLDLLRTATGRLLRVRDAVAAVATFVNQVFQRGDALVQRLDQAAELGQY